MNSIHRISRMAMALVILLATRSDTQGGIDLPTTCLTPTPGAHHSGTGNWQLHHALADDPGFDGKVLAPFTSTPIVFFTDSVARDCNPWHIEGHIVNNGPAVVSGGILIRLVPVGAGSPLYYYRGYTNIASGTKYAFRWGCAPIPQSSEIKWVESAGGNPNPDTATWKISYYNLSNSSAVLDGSIVEDRTACPSPASPLRGSEDCGGPCSVDADCVGASADCNMGDGIPGPPHPGTCYCHDETPTPLDTPTQEQIDSATVLISIEECGPDCPAVTSWGMAAVSGLLVVGGGLLFRRKLLSAGL